MNQDQKQPAPFTARRRFLRNTLKLALLGTIITPLTQACNSKSKNKGHTDPGNNTKNKSLSSKSKNKRHKWSNESLLVNSKTGVMHLPTSKLYHYYDEIKKSHIKTIAVGSWAAILQDNVRIHKQQSGNILEILGLQRLRSGINDESLSQATDTLAAAFAEPVNNINGYNLNTTNFRLHELILQLISLNNSIPAADKWLNFKSKIKSPVSLRRRQKWMENETGFMQRVNYINERRNDYIARLNKRAAQYDFT